MNNIVYSNQAEIDLENAIEYIAKDSILNAIEYLNGYNCKIELLKSNPYMGIDCKYKLIKRDCQVLIYKNHIIIYKFNKVKKDILIIRIYHTKTDYINKINNKEKNNEIQ